MTSSKQKKPGPDRDNGDESVKPLAKALGQSEEVKGLVQEAALELSSISAVLRQEATDLWAAPAVGEALVKTETVEDKVQVASDKLSAVNLALKTEVRERQMLEFTLAAVTEKAEASQNAAFHDLLTGLPNRALFNDRLDHGLAQAKRHGRNLAVMFIDLDHFKKINDTHGHAAGDEVLKMVSDRLTASTREDDTVSRHGGDEFLFLLTEVGSEQELTRVAEKLIASIEIPFAARVNGVQVDLSVGASIGIAIYPKDGMTPQALVDSADRAMYCAKKAGARFAFAK